MELGWGECAGLRLVDSQEPHELRLLGLLSTKKWADGFACSMCFTFCHSVAQRLCSYLILHGSTTIQARRLKHVCTLWAPSERFEGSEMCWGASFRKQVRG